jgi:hypothetical protein
MDNDHVDSLESDIEMANFDDIVVTPMAQSHSGIPYGGDEEDSDNERGEGAETALLSPRKLSHSTGPSSHMWSQAKGIVLEVFIHVHCLRTLRSQTRRARLRYY